MNNVASDRSVAPNQVADFVERVRAVASTDTVRKIVMIFSIKYILIWPLV